MIRNYAGPLQAVTLLFAIVCAVVAICTGVWNAWWLMALLSAWAFLALCDLEEADRPTR